MRIVVTLPVASCYVARASGNVNAETADILTCEGMVYSRASILTEVPMMYQSLKAKMTARGMTVQQEQEENQRGE